MKCKEIEELLSAYTDGELSNEIRNTISKHIEGCAGCKAALAGQINLHEQMRAIRKTPELPDMENAIMSVVKNNGAKKHKPWLRPTLIAAPFVLALAMILPIVIPNLALTPEKVLAKAREAVTDIKSYRMSSEYYIWDPVAKEYVLRAFSGIKISGDRYSELQEFITPQNYYREVTGVGTYEAIGIGDKVYGRVTGTMGYAPGVSSSERQQYMPSEILTRKALSMFVKIEELPEENIDGVLCYHYQGSVDMVKFGIEYPQQAGAFRTSTINEEYWIGKEDYIVRQYKSEVIRGDDVIAKLPMLTGRSLEVWKYSDFNASISIEQPLDGQGNLLPGWVILPVQ